MYNILTRILIFFCISAILVGAFFLWYTPLIKVNEELHCTLLETQKKLQAQNELYFQLSDEIYQLKNNPRRLEKYIREGFRCSKPEETVFVFKNTLPPFNAEVATE